MPVKKNKTDEKAKSANKKSATSKPAKSSSGKKPAKAVKEKINLMVLFGGRSSEHEVSLVSAKNVMDAIDEKKYNVIPVGITKSGNFLYLEGSREPSQILEKGSNAIFVAQPGVDYNLWIFDNENGEITDTMRVDAAFPVLHGPYGEDGKIQGLFEMANIPYVGSDVLGSACGMDKTVMKNLFVAQQLPVPNYAYFTKHNYENSKKTIIDMVKKTFQWPVFVKPASLGSSVGISKASSQNEFEKAIEKAFEYDFKVIVEQAIDGREIEVAVMGNFDLTVAAPGEVIPAAEFYDYKDKYKNGQAKFNIPVKLPAAKLDEIETIAVDAYEAVNAKGFARVDLFMEKSTGDIFVNEINTIPGFTAISMFPKMFENSGVSNSELVDKLINYAFEYHALKNKSRI